MKEQGSLYKAFYKEVNMSFFTHTPVVIFFIFAFILSFIDIKSQKIPRFLSFSFIGIVYAFRILEALLGFFVAQNDEEQGIAGFFRALISPTLGLFLGFILFFIIRLLSKKKLGLADLWFSAAMGTFLGFVGWYFAVAFASLMALTWIFSLAIFRNIRSKAIASKPIPIFKTFRQIRLPFIPFLTAGSLCAYLVLSL